MALIKSPPHLPLGVRFSESKLQSIDNPELRKLQNDLWNLIESYEFKLGRSRQATVKLAIELDLDQAKEMMKQVQHEIEARKLCGRW